LILVVNTKGKGFGTDISIVDTDKLTQSIISVKEMVSFIRNRVYFDNLYLCLKKASFDKLKYLLKGRVHFEVGRTYLVPVRYLNKSFFNSCESVRVSDKMSTATVDSATTDLRFYYDTEIGLDLGLFLHEQDNYKVSTRYNSEGRYELKVNCFNYEHKFVVDSKYFIVNGEVYGCEIPKYGCFKVKYLYIMKNGGIRIRLDAYRYDGEHDIYNLCADVSSSRVIYPKSVTNTYYGDVYAKEE